MKKIIIEERKSFTKMSLINILVTLVVAALAYFLCLPAMNLSSISFWVFILGIIGFNMFLTFITNIDEKGRYNGNVKIISTILMLFSAVILIIFVINIFLSPLFDSKGYANRIEVDKDGDFYKEVKQVDFKTLPLLDKKSSQKLGDRVMGQMPELVSQFYVSNLYTQINYNNDIVRITPLEYNGFFKYLANRKEGVKGYITVNSVSGSAKLKKLDKGMKYMPSAILMEDLNRKLRFTYPTKIFGKENFEIDNEGNPYWVIPTIKYDGVELRPDIEGAILLDPVTGKSKYYDVRDVPTWVDHVYDADLLINQIDDWGMYNGGFFNSLFGQKNVVRTTDGYNYTVMNDDVYLYTGITSVASDESNLGFTLTNLRTKETNFYAVPGAEEFSAMASAEGQVQQMKYNATFPLLINLNNKATYLISLKDNAGLVKMYAFVDVEDYQKVVVTDASKGIEAAAVAYLGEEDTEFDGKNEVTKEITISYINSAIVNNNTFYYIKDSDGKKYQTSIKTNKKVLPFLNVGDRVEITYIDSENVSEINKIK